MPKVKPLVKPDPLEVELRTEIGAGMARLQISPKELAYITGINYSTLMKRIGRKGDIKSLRIGELIAIRRALK